MKITPSQAKNLMRRALRLLVDPEPTWEDKQRIRYYFEYRCAYCNIDLKDVPHDIDHLVSASLGGTNALANRVLSCKPCNAKEKRDRDWRDFLREKAESMVTYVQREKRIQEWVAANGGHPELNFELKLLIDEESERISKEFDIACARIRDVRG